MALIRVRADATNTAIWQKQKLNVVELSAAFTHGQIFDDSSTDPKDQQLRSEGIVVWLVFPNPTGWGR